MSKKNCHLISQEHMMKTFITEVFENVIENMNADEDVIYRYFSSNYIQWVDGHILNYQDFIQHMQKQKTMIHSAKVTIDHCLVEKKTICTVHRVHMGKKNGEEIVAKVIAYFEVENRKIVRCDELTRIVGGNKEDQKIGFIK